MRGELRVVTVERDLLKERVQAYLHKLYAARSTGQKDLFFNEAEALVPTASAEPAKEGEPGVDPSAFARMTAAFWSRSAPRSANNATSFPSRYG